MWVQTEAGSGGTPAALRAAGVAKPKALAQLRPSQIGALREAQCNSLDRLSVAALVRQHTCAISPTPRRALRLATR